MKKNLLGIALLLAFVASMPKVASSQSSIAGDTIKAMLIADWQRAKAYTDEYLATMPANKYSFKPNDSIRTFAQQMLHLAQANNFFIMIATDAQGPFGGRDLEKAMSAQSADSVKYYVDKSYDGAIAAIQNLSPAKYLEYKSFSMGQVISGSRLSWLLKAFEHQTHHRGQTTIYIRTAGYRPPQEKLF